MFRLGSYSRGSSLCLHSIGLRSGKELWKVYYRVKIGTASENREKNLVALYAGCFNHIVRSGRRCVDMRNFYYILQMCGRRRHSFGNVIYQFRHAENATLEILAHYSVHFTSTSAIASTLLRFKCASGGQGCRRVIKFCFSHEHSNHVTALGLRESGPRSPSPLERYARLSKLHRDFPCVLKGSGLLSPRHLT